MGMGLDERGIVSPGVASCASSVVVEPAAVFLPKFENAGEATRAQYEAIDARGDCVLVASVKSSGSLWLATAVDGRIVCSSKNGNQPVSHQSLILMSDHDLRLDFALQVLEMCTASPAITRCFDTCVTVLERRAGDKSLVI